MRKKVLLRTGTVFEGQKKLSQKTGYFRKGQKWPQPAPKKLKTNIYKIYTCKTILVGLYYQRVWAFPSSFQNQNAGMIFSKIASDFTVLEGIAGIQFKIRFLVRVIFQGSSFVNLKATSIL